MKIVLFDFPNIIGIDFFVDSNIQLIFFIKNLTFETKKFRRKLRVFFNKNTYKIFRYCDTKNYSFAVCLN